MIDVNEKVTELDEVVVTPSQRQKFLDLKSPKNLKNLITIEINLQELKM